jgi:hypothetical protein
VWGTTRNAWSRGSAMRFQPFADGSNRGMGRGSDALRPGDPSQAGAPAEADLTCQVTPYPACRAVSFWRMIAPGPIALGVDFGNEAYKALPIPTKRIHHVRARVAESSGRLGVVLLYQRPPQHSRQSHQ